MKAVMLSIKPKYCELIASGKKTIEARKTRPDLEPPFKCYSYCTKAKKSSMGLYLDELYRLPTGKIKYGCSVELACYDDYTHDNFLNGKVIGEYVCDTYVIDKTFGHDALFNGAACLSEEEASAYSNGKTLFGLHISELKLYDKPKRLSEFCKPCDPVPGCSCDYCKTHGLYLTNMIIQRPPQSWCYVEELI